MYAIDITFGLFIVLFTILLLRWIRRPRLQFSGFRSQRMCPSCGLITPRLSPRCQECGKTFTTAG
jgi:predicted amidophosphoribosyltransferase